MNSKTIILHKKGDRIDLRNLTLLLVPNTGAVKSLLINSRIDYRYTYLITNIYSEATITSKIHDGTRHIRRGVRQGGSISPKRFNQALKEVFKKLDWK